MTALAGTSTLVRLALRRDVPLLLGVTALLACLLVAVTTSFESSYPNAAALQGYAAAMAAAPAQHFFNGPGDGLDTIGGMVVFEVGGYAVVVVAVLAILSVVRHSRALEADGVAEMVRAGRVGTSALAASAGIVAVGSAGLWGMTSALTLGSLGLGWMGAIAYGLSLTAAGALFAAVASVACQLVEQPRTATLVATAILAAAFVVRGLGDMQGSAAVWVSPLGWAQASRPFGKERWWPFLLAAAAVAVAYGVVAGLAARRDLGAGWWPARPGRARASGPLRRLGGLVASQQWPLARGWWIAIAVLALSFGLVSQEFADAGDLLDMSAFFGTGNDPVAGLVEFSALLLALLSAAAGAAVIAVAGREESTGRLDAVVAASVGRCRWVMCQIGGALVTTGVGIGLAAGGLTLGIAWAGVERGAWDTAAVVVAYLPAAWLVVALAAALFGVRARARPFAWLIIVYIAIAGVFGTILRLPSWAIDLSPFSHAPTPPGESLLGLPFGALAAIATALVVLAVELFRRRDVGR